MIQPYKVLSYTYNAISFIWDKEIFINTSAIYLFGSAVRGQLTEKSDIDIFIECKEENEDFVKQRAEANLLKFYKSKDFEKWQHLGIENPISIIAGNLKAWALKASIFSEGMIVFKKSFTEKKDEFERKIVLIFELPKQKPKYLKFIRELFGRSEYVNKGYLNEISGERISANVIIVPQEHLSNAERFLQKHKIKYQIRLFFIQKE